MTKHRQGDPRIHKVITVTKASVARSQLETAIKLWFDEADLVSIHTLAVAAHDCYNALGKAKIEPKKRPSQNKIQNRSAHFQWCSMLPVALKRESPLPGSTRGFPHSHFNLLTHHP